MLETLKTQARAYLRPIPGLGIERQRQMARDAGCHVVYEHDAPTHSPLSQRDQWVRSLRRGDTAWVASIQCLLLAPRLRTGGYSPTADLAAITNHVLAIGATLLDVRAGVSSEKPEEWAAHVLHEARRAGQGERPAAVRKRTAKAGADARWSGVTTRWRSPAMASQLEMQIAIWSSRKFTVKQAQVKLHPELRALSLPTLYDLLGDRGGTGGRPRKGSR